MASKKLTSKSIVMNVLEQMLYDSIEDILKHAESRIGNKQISRSIQSIDAEGAVNLAQALLVESIATTVYISRLQVEPSFDEFEGKDVVEFRNRSLDYMRKMLAEMITQPYEHQEVFPEIEGEAEIAHEEIAVVASE